MDLESDINYIIRTYNELHYNNININQKSNILFYIKSKYFNTLQSIYTQHFLEHIIQYFEMTEQYEICNVIIKKIELNNLINKNYDRINAI